jgi:hypothetical protein
MRHSRSQGTDYMTKYAFPYADGSTQSPGMTLREWFAGLALQGFLASAHETEDKHHTHLDEATHRAFEDEKIARRCVGVADQLLKVLDQSARPN